MTGLRQRPWLPRASELHWDNTSAVVDRPPATTLGDVLAMVAGQTLRFLTRRVRALVAAVRAYRSNLDA